MDILARVPITFTTADGGTTHAPLVFASVGGAAPARYILDTGSDVHLLNEDLADELGLDKVPGEEGIDHSGATMPSWTVGDVTLDLGGQALTLKDVVSIPAPPPFPGFWIRGILSPQLLHPTAMMAIDLAADEFMLLDGTTNEIADFLNARSPALTLLTLTRDADFPSTVVRGAIDGFADMPTMLNTGGKATEFSSAAVPGLTAPISERLGGGVGGGDYSGWSVGPQTLVVGGHRLPVAALRIRPEMHDPQGLVGMDVLRGTVLTVAADVSRPVFWQIP